jgi:nitrogen fixation-related uncharacterized protein
MIGEFTGWDANLVGPYGLREFSLIPFGIGLFILGYYYLIYARKNDFEDQVHQQTEALMQQESAKSRN